MIIKPPHYHVSFAIKEEEEALINKLREFLQNKVFPKDEIKKFVRLTEGLTNVLYKVEVGSSIVLARVNGLGTENIIDRDKELAYMTILSHYKVAPKIHATFENGYIYDYIEGKPLEPNKMYLYATSIAKELAKFHKAKVEPVDGDKSPQIFKTIRKWISDAKILPFEGEKRTTFQRIDLECLLKELDELESLLKDCETVFCHNDLLAYNIIYDPDKDHVSFIDYEYCGYNYRASDIGNHFAEYTGFELNIADYPTHQQQEKFVTEYLKEYNGADPSQQEIQKLVAESNLFAMIANIFWGVWGIQQAYYSEIDFDYLTYCEKRLKWYYNGKQNAVKQYLEQQ